MKIAYVTLFDPHDVRNWSGTDLHIWKSLEAQGATIKLIGNLRHGRSLGRKLRKLWSRHLEGRETLHFWDVATARDFAADVAGRLKNSDAEVVLSPSPIPLAFLECPQPRVLWTDACYSALSRDYWEFDPRRISSVAAAGARRVEKAACGNCALTLFASEWGAQWSLQEGGARREATAVVPFGANMDITHDLPAAREFARARGTSPVNLLFVGVDWQRKGGDKAVKVTQILRARGIDAQLTVVGITAEMNLPAFVKSRGFISKHTSDGLRDLQQLYRESHFLLVPTEAEAYGLVFAEASAFGVPSVSHRVGGVTTVVQDERNGKLFDKDAPPEQWADWMERTLRTPGRLVELAASSFEEYAQRLNWRVAGQRVMALLRDRLAVRETPRPLAAHA